MTEKEIKVEDRFDLDRAEGFAMEEDTNPFRLEEEEEEEDLDLSIYGNGRLVNPAARFVCQLCRRVYKNQYGLDMHKKNRHSNVKRFRCLKCNKDFQLCSSLFGHIKTAHDDEKGYKCKECGEIFTGTQKLTDHQKTIHRKLHQCILCDKKFLKYCSIVSHYKGYHHNLKTSY